MDKKTASNKPENAGKSREDRLKQALKANLAKRKSQARARRADGADGADTDKGKG